MEKQVLKIEMYGPCNMEDKLIPNAGDTVARLRRDGRVQFITVHKVEWNFGEPRVTSVDGELLHLNDLYLLYSMAYNAHLEYVAGIRKNKPNMKRGPQVRDEHSGMPIC